MAYKRQTPKNLTLDRVIEILKEVIEIYPTVSELYYPILFMKPSRKLYPTKIQYWKDKYPDEIQPLLNELDTIAEAKITASILNGGGSTTGQIFYAKCKMKWVPEEIKIKVDGDKDIAEITHDSVITIGFDSDGD